MIKLGIVGAENSHSYKVAATCNVNESVPMRVTAIWGETEEFAKAAAEQGSIPKIVSDWRDLAGEADVIMIDHRHARRHYEPAEFFLKQGMPTFVDKPFTFSTDEARKLLDLSESTGAPVMTFSALPRRPAFQEYKKRIEEAGKLIVLNSTGPANVDSEYGGIFFYGIHQVDAMVELMGVEVESVSVERRGPNAIAVARYSGDRWCTMNLIADGGAFHWQACMSKGVLAQADERGPDPYIVSAQLICRLVEEKKSPFSRERMFAPIAVLEAMAESLAEDRTVQVKR